MTNTSNSLEIPAKETLERVDVPSESAENEKGAIPNDLFALYSLFVFVEKKQAMANSLNKLRKQLYGKVLLIPSILLTKGLITAHIKMNSEEMEEALNYLLDKKLLTSEKYLECAKRKVTAYLKFAPENCDEPLGKYVLQGRLVEVDVNVNDYIKSIKTIQFATKSLRPSALLIKTLQETPYVQLNIDLSMKCTGIRVLFDGLSMISSSSSFYL